ncbi:hypothetical protein ALC53_07331 [Atta colombica]|uniref:Uncharacterized protein n=1 Tax=Atta colombica TaxID=520822 RepID=A0A195BCP5_9HYME|nr:hypothetical protein ALC53_07331 [Atta colombica]
MPLRINNINSTLFFNQPLKEIIHRSKVNNGIIINWKFRVSKNSVIITINTNRLMFLWGYVDRCPNLLYDVYDLFISITTYR